MQVARDHGREVLKNWVPESYSFFEMLGVELVVFDFKKWHGEEVILNLNDPVDTSLYQAFDLLIDPGTTEHVFNIAQAMKSIAMMVNVGGYIYHQTPLVHINHGFYNLSPTFYSDFYKLNGFDIKELKYFSKSLDAHGFMVAREDLDPYATFYEVKSPSTNSVLVQKMLNKVVSYPTQTIYKSEITDVQALEKIFEHVKSCKKIALVPYGLNTQYFLGLCDEHFFEISVFDDDPSLVKKGLAKHFTELEEGFDAIIITSSRYATVLENKVSNYIKQSKFYSINDIKFHVS